MYTQCRGCGEVFVVEVDHLIHARGQVRCNLCGTVFDGMETLSAVKPHEDEDLLLHDFDNAPPLLTQAFHVVHQTDEPEDDFEDELDIDFDFEIESQSKAQSKAQTQSQVQPQADPQSQFKAPFTSLSPVQNPEPIDFDIATELDEIVAEAVAESVVPQFVTFDEPTGEEDSVAEKKSEKTKKAQLLWGGLVVATVLGLLLQAKSAITSGQVQLSDEGLGGQLCEWFSCTKASDEVDLNAISLVSRNIRPHPGRDESLIISASMINANESKQKFPALEIKLSDLDGQIVAMRRFMAEEYVPDEILEVGFMANTLIPINLEIVSPGADAVAFEIGFVQP